VKAFRYSLKPLPSIPLTAGERFLSFDYRRGAWVHDLPVVFLSLDSLLEPAIAQEILSITYAPRWRNLVNIPARIRLLDNQGNSYLGPTAENAVWPAFGHKGGGTDILMVDTPAPLRVKSSDDLESTSGMCGGWKDPFCQDDVLPAIEKELRATASGGILGVVARQSDAGELRIKISSTGAVAQWFAGDLFYAISAAHRNEPAGITVRVWGSVWRELSPPLPRGFTPRLTIASKKPTPSLRQGWGSISYERRLPLVTVGGGTKTAEFQVAAAKVLETMIGTVARELVSVGGRIRSEPRLRPGWSHFH